MEILIKDAGYIVCDSENIIEDSDIYIKDHKIKEIGKNLNKKISPQTKIINSRDKVVIPGLINAHTHLFQSMLRGCRDDLELKPWCEEVTFPFADVVHQHDWHRGEIDIGYHWTMLSSLEMIRSGVTGCINMDLTLDTIFEAWQEIGMRGIGAVTAVNRWVPDDLSRDDDDRKRDILNFIDKWHQDPEGGGLLQVFMAPTTCFACTPDFLQWLINRAEEYDLGVQVHISETRWEVEQGLEEFGTTPLNYMEELDLLRREISGVHCVHLTEEEVDLAVKRGLIPVHCPKSNMKLGSGIAPVVKMLSRGLPVALATDGAASNDSLDMLEEMRTAAFLQKVAHEDPGVISAADVFKMATENGARAARIDAGKIAEGKLADMVILDLKQENTAPVHDILQNIVYCVKNNNVETSIINGRVVMEEGEILTVDEERVKERAIAYGRGFCEEVDFEGAMEAEF